MSELINPYIAGAPVTETRMFFGREDVFDWIQNSLSGRYADHILVIHGQRRVGKTSVLKQLGNRLPEKYIPVFFDLQGRTHTTLDRFLWWLAREIVRVLKQERDITVPAPEKDVFAADLEYFETRFLPSLLPYIGGNTLLLTFDEFDNLEESEIKEELARPLIDYLRRLMGEEGLSFIFSIGSSGRKLENMQAAYTEFFKTALYKKISFLSEEQTHGLITRPVEGLLEYDRKGVKHIFELASGHPYFTQLTCHELFARCQRTGQRQVKDEDVNAVLDDVVERGTVNLKFTWDEASDIERWGLAALAQLDKADNRTLTDFLRKQRVRFSDSDLTSGLLHLREKDILTSDNHFVIYLLKIWLQKNRPIEQVREELTEVNPIANRYIEIGLEFKDAGLFDKAIESFQEALAIAPENIQAQVNIALTYVEQKAFDKAVAEFEKALGIDDEDVVARAGLCDAHLALGDAALAKGRSKDAIQSYQRVLDINKEHLEARQRMAEISRQRAEKALVDGKDDEALSAFAEALKYTPEDQGLIERVEQVRAEKKAKVLAELAARSEKEARARNWEKAIATLNEALEIAPRDESILEKIESIKARQLQERLDGILIKVDQAEKVSRWDTAIAALNEYLSLKPEDASIQKRLSDLVEARHAAWLSAILARSAEAASNKQWDEAVSALNEVLALEPENAEIRAKVSEVRAAQRKARLEAILRRADLAVRASKWDEAISALNEGLASEPDNEQIQRKLAEVREARRSARLEAAIRLANASAQAGKWDIAIQSLNEILAIEPENAQLQKKLVEVKAGQRESQLKALHSQARALAKAEKFDEALATWQGYLALGPEDVEKAQKEIESVQQAQALAKLYAEALAAYAKKNYEKTIGLLKEVIDRDVNYKDASLLLAQAIELRRAARNWWQNKWLWGGVGGVALLIIAWFAFRPGSPLLTSQSRPPLEVTVTTGAPLIQSLPTDTPGPTSTPSPTPTPLPFSWARLNSGQFLPRDQVTAIVIDPTDPGVMYVGTQNAGVYKTIDGGFSWQPALEGLANTQVNSLSIDSQNPRILYAGTTGGTFKTEDGGGNWSEAGAGIYLLVDPQDSSHLYARNADGIFETTDQGNTWETVYSSNEACPGDIFSWAIHPLDGKTLFILAGKECETGVYLSNDGGRSWNLLVQREVFDSPGDNHLVVGLDGQGDYYIVTAEGLIHKQSQIGDPTWRTLLDFGPPAIFDSTGWVYFKCDTHLCKFSLEGEQKVTLGIPDVGVVRSITALPDGANTIYVGGEGLSVSRDGGLTWTKSNNGMGSGTLQIDSGIEAGSSLYLQPGDCVPGVSQGDEIKQSLYISNDGGSTWNLSSQLGCYLMKDADKSTLYRLGTPIWYTGTENAYSGWIWRSPDSGQTWEKAFTPVGLRTVSVHPSQSGRLQIHTNWDGREEHETQYASEDAGQTWNRTDPLANTKPCYGSTLHFIDKYRPMAIDPGDGNHVLFIDEGRLQESRDSCDSWDQLANQPPYPLNGVAIDPKDPSRIYIGADSGAYISFDSGRTWGQVNDGLLGATVVYSIAVDQDSNVYAATPYGIFKLESK